MPDGRYKTLMAATKPAKSTATEDSIERVHVDLLIADRRLRAREITPDEARRVVAGIRARHAALKGDA